MMKTKYAKDNYGDSYWKIVFDDHLGESHTYMNCAFETPRSAELELGRIKREQKKFKKDNPYFDPNSKSNMNVSSISIGLNWRIEKIKFRKL